MCDIWKYSVQKQGYFGTYEKIASPSLQKSFDLGSIFPLCDGLSCKCAINSYFGSIVAFQPKNVEKLLLKVFFP